MAKYTIVWTHTAISQRRHVLSYWVERNQSTEYPLQLLKKISKQIDYIRENPNAFPKSAYRGIRVSALNHYSIFYQIKGEKIYVMAFWDNRQDPKKLMKYLGSQP